MSLANVESTRPAGAGRDGDSGAPRPAATAFRGLVWREWLEHGSAIRGFLSVWIAGLWVAVLFGHPYWLLALGAFYVLAVVFPAACKDAVEGSEEFSFSLPPTRGLIYQTRMLVTGVPLLVMLGAGLPAIALDLPQRVWGLLVESGTTVSFGAGEHSSSSYVLALCGPTALYSSLYVFGALTRGRGAGALAGGVVLPVALAAIVAAMEVGISNRFTGVVLGPALLVFSLAALLFGQRAFQQKEGISRPRERSSRSLIWVWVAAVVAVLVLLSLMGSYTRFQVAREHQMEKARVMQARARHETEAARQAYQRRASESRDGTGTDTPPEPPDEPAGRTPSKSEGKSP